MKRALIALALACAPIGPLGAAECNNFAAARRAHGAAARVVISQIFAEHREALL